MGNVFSCVSCRGGEPTRKLSYRAEVRTAPDITSHDASETAMAIGQEQSVAADEKRVEIGSTAVPATQGNVKPDEATARCLEDAAADIEDVAVVALPDAGNTANEATEPELVNVTDEKRAANESAEKTSDVGATGPEAMGGTARGRGKVKATVSWGDAEPETKPTKDVTGVTVSGSRACTLTEQVRQVGCDIA